MTFEQIGALFLKEQEQKLAITTYEKYSSILEKYVFPKIGKVLIEDVDNEAIKSMIVAISEDEANTGREGAGLKSGTLKLIDQVTRMVVDFFKSDGDDDRSYIEGGDSKSYERLSPQEIERVCRCAYYNRTPEMLGILLMLYTGIRIGEICALSCDDIDLESNSIFIHKSVHRVKNKDRGATSKTQNVISEIPSRKQIRTVIFPEELLDYMKEFYHPGCNLLTANNLPAEAKTVRGRVDRIFEAYRINDIPFQRLHRTYTDGAADVEILQKVFAPKDIKVLSNRLNDLEFEKPAELDKGWLCREMANDLKALRLLIGVTPLEMGSILDLSEEDYRKIETEESSISWSKFLTLLFFFCYNPKTAGVVEELGLYPQALKDHMMI